MRFLALLALALAVAGCDSGFKTWNDLPFTSGSNPNMPAGSSENMRRVEGETANVAPLRPEPGDVWPGPIQPPPTLEDLENQSGEPVQGQGQPGAPVGSSTPPGSPPLRLPPLPPAAPSNTLPGQSTVTGVPNAAAPSPGQTVQTGRGTGVVTGGGSNYQTITTPGTGGQSIVVPNGNGTSTIIHPDGTVETIPTPKQ